MFDTVFTCLDQVCMYIAKLAFRQLSCGCFSQCIYVSNDIFWKRREEYSMNNQRIPLHMLIHAVSCVVVQAAKAWWGKESDEKVKNQLSRRPKEGCSITPLAASAFRSNWILFRKIYDKYESLADKRWTREEVSHLNGRTAKPTMFSWRRQPLEEEIC